MFYFLVSPNLSKSTTPSSFIIHKHTETIAPTITSTSLSPSYLVSPTHPTEYYNKQRWKRAILDEPTTIQEPFHCKRFTEPFKNNNTFFSPMDPTSSSSNYPKNANCVFVLEGESFIYFIDFALTTIVLQSDIISTKNTYFF